MRTTVEKRSLRTTGLWAVLTLVASSLLVGGPGVAEVPEPGPYVVVLGIAQDGGYPQAGTPPGAAWEEDSRRLVASLGIVDPRSGRRWLIDATPDFPEQLHRLDGIAPRDDVPGLDGIFLTHGHVGHYAGLIHLGREVMGARSVPLWVMPRMDRFLRDNAPWELLVGLGNVELRPLEAGVPVTLGDDLTITPVLVPHRDEYTETVGYHVQGPSRSLLYVPDIDKWERWDEAGTRVEEWIGRVDVALLDGSFFADGEIPDRAMSEIPHPFVEESLERFAPLPDAERAKVRFLHLNRTNPLIDPANPEARAVAAAGCSVARPGERHPL